MTDIPDLARIRAADRRLIRKALLMYVLMLLVGLVLPNSWRELFGPIAIAIDGAGSLIPATAKSAVLSPIAELVCGFIGVGLCLIPIFVGALCWKDPFDERWKFALSRPDFSPLKALSFLYLVFMPALVVGLWVLLTLPGSIESLQRQATGGAQLLVLMLSSRVALAILGSLVPIATSLLLFLVAWLLIGPFYFAWNRG